MPQESDAHSTIEATTAEAAVREHLARQNRKDLLRLIACGSVDDGKSTLIGRLLYDSKAVFEDQLVGLTADSARFGTTGVGQLDLALLVDGLAAEREQGITIDVAYRFFATNRRTFIVADTPGHEQYTRNMVTGASTADVAVLLVDARKGVLTQTRRHSTIVALLGVRTIVLAVNKMDAVAWDRTVFDRITADYRAFAARLGVTNVVCVPVSALTGDNVTSCSQALDWYDGPTLLGALETLEIIPPGDDDDRPFRMAVQWVNRPNQDFRGFSGTIAGGGVRLGDAVAVLPGGHSSRVARIVTMDGDLDMAQPGQAVTLVLTDEVDASRGDVIVAADNRPEVADQFAAHMVWMDEQPLLPGRSYLLRAGTATVGAQVTELKHIINVNTQEHVAAKHLRLNDIAFCNLALDRPIPFDAYTDNRDTGAFILIDRLTNATAGGGMIRFPLRRAANLHRRASRLDKVARAGGVQKPCALWFTGLSGSGKSSVADRLEQALHRLGCRTMILDGDNIRHGLSRDLGFTDSDRVENIRRAAEVAKLMVEAGLIVLVSFISPFRNERSMARALFDEGEFLEIFMDTPLAVCEARDSMGLYKKARAGQLPHFTGIDSVYEAPESPDIILKGAECSTDEMVAQLVADLQRRGVI